MERVNGTLNISVNVECPACKDVINLLDHAQFRDDGYLLGEVLVGNAWEVFGCTDLGDEFTCPKCHETFIISDIEW